MAFALAMMNLLVLVLRAQGLSADFLARVNGLRQSLGLPAYTLHAALNAAAANHAEWLARTGIDSHTQDDGSTPRTRAPAAGYSSSWVSENYYFGLKASAEKAWAWWLNSPAHYAGLVSPYYNNIGIASASAGDRSAYVLVFGNSSGRLLESSASPASGGAAPSFVFGSDEWGNILHEVQSGDTIGDIALIYGYTWEDIPYMLEINGMSAEDIRLLKPGSIFLVPPQDGTFTPTADSPTATVTAAFTATARGETRDGAGSAAATAEPTRAATRELRIHLAPTEPATAEPAMRSAEDGDAELLIQLLLLGIAIPLQLGVLGGAAFELLRRSR